MTSRSSRLKRSPCDSSRDLLRRKVGIGGEGGLEMKEMEGDDDR